MYSNGKGIAKKNAQSYLQMEVKLLALRVTAHKRMILAQDNRHVLALHLHSTEVHELMKTFQLSVDKAGTNPSAIFDPIEGSHSRIDSVILPSSSLRTSSKDLPLSLTKFFSSHRKVLVAAEPFSPL